MAERPEEYIPAVMLLSLMIGLLHILMAACNLVRPPLRSLHLLLRARFIPTLCTHLWFAVLSADSSTSSQLV